MERVYKNMMGQYKEENIEKGKAATNIILTIEEYNKLLEDIQNAEIKTEKTIQNANLKINEYKNTTDSLINQHKNTFLKRIESVQRDFNKAKVENLRLTSLNSNLLRISREKANAKRGLRPKKEHTGYLVLDSQQYNYIFRYISKGKTINETFPCWKVKIQTPYDSSIDFEVIKINIQNDLIKIIGSSLGIQKRINVETYEFKDFQELWTTSVNFIFKTTYKANFKSGLWEIEYLVKNSISIPQDMRL